jgi:hypothetical protein
MRRRCSLSIRKQAIYAAIEAEHAQREIVKASPVVFAAVPDLRDPLEVARAAAAALKA